jgi:hypothetical protein
MIWPSIVAVAVIVLAFVDWVYLRKQYSRVFFLELGGFVIVVCAVLEPDWLTLLAHTLGIGRGVDLLIYTVLIWLFRESILGRVRYHRHRSQLTHLVREIAKADEVKVNAEKN